MVYPAVKDKDGRTIKAPELPIYIIVCSKCKRPGGTLVKAGDKYYHKECR